MRSAKYYVDFIEGNSYINNIFAAEKNLRRLPRLLTYMYLKGILSPICTLPHRLRLMIDALIFGPKIQHVHDHSKRLRSK